MKVENAHLSLIALSPFFAALRRFGSDDGPRGPLCSTARDIAQKLMPKTYISNASKSYLAGFPDLSTTELESRAHTYIVKGYGRIYICRGMLQ